VSCILFFGVRHSNTATLFLSINVIPMNTAPTADVLLRPVKPLLHQVARRPVTHSPMVMNMCVLLKHNLMVCANKVPMALDVYNLISGAFIERVGSKGYGCLRFNFNMGGLCATPEGDGLLLADCLNHAVQELTVVEGQRGAHAPPTLACRRVISKVQNGRWLPEFVDCNERAIVAADFRGIIWVLAWSTGAYLHHIDALDAKRPSHGVLAPCSVQVMRSGLHVAVADAYVSRVCWYEIATGTFVDSVYTGDVSNCQRAMIECGTVCTPAFVIARNDSTNAGAKRRRALAPRYAARTHATTPVTTICSTSANTATCALARVQSRNNGSSDGDGSVFVCNTSALSTRTSMYRLHDMALRVAWLLATQSMFGSMRRTKPSCRCCCSVM
jgi:hypothetical protein